MRSLSVSIGDEVVSRLQSPKRTRGFCDFSESGCTVSVQGGLPGVLPHTWNWIHWACTCLEAGSTISFQKRLTFEGCPELWMLPSPLPSSCPDLASGRGAHERSSPVANVEVGIKQLLSWRPGHPSLHGALLNLHKD